MAGVPPTIPPTATQPGLETPSHEWASKTTSMLDPTSETTNTGSSMNPTTKELLTASHDHPDAPSMAPTASASSTVSTPGIPGAYKPDPEEKAGTAPNVDLRETASKVTQSVQEAAQTVGQTAASYLPAAAQYLPKGVVDTVAGYLPTQGPHGVVRASIHDAPHDVSYPSTEIAGAGANEHVSGVGALPGTIAEDAVAKAPDERNAEQQHPSTTTGLTNVLSGTAVGGVLGRVAQTARETTGGVAEKAKQTVTGQTSELPSKESPGLSHHQGVGSLPGSTTEQGVALLPSERLAGSTTGATDPAAGTHRRAVEDVPSSLPSQEQQGPGHQGAHSVGGVGILPGSQAESGVARLPDDRSDVALGAMTATQELKPATLPSQEPYGNEEQKRARDGERQGVQEGVGSLVGLRAESGVAKLPDERSGLSTTSSRAAQVKPVTLPTQEPYGNEEQKRARDGERQGVQEGVGSLVGVRNESGVAVPPDERQPSTTSSQAQSSPVPVEQHESKEGGDNEGVKGASGVAGASAVGANKEQKVSGHHGLSNKGDSYNTDYHPSQLHPPPEDFKADPTSASDNNAGGLGASEAQSKVPVPDEQNTSVDQTSGKKESQGTPSSADDRKVHAAHAGEGSEGEKKRKVGFLDKMKGEAKILLGRAEGKKGHDKVEEGKKIKAGEA